ncbi:molybdate ABC transporter substrate-binding protein [Gordonia sputi]|nr:molybdate ABC transporter substrate-binding protein [Gordonia sputi]
MLAVCAALIAVIAAVAGCSSDSDSSSGASSSTDGQKVTLNVYAAASLKNTFTELADAFEKAHSDVDVKLSFAGSSALVTQINQGADADVIATADERTMQKLGDKAVDPAIFATNTLVIATAPGNPKQINGFASLKNADVKTVVCAPEVPCGAATVTVEKNTGVELSPVSQETSVTSVLTKVTSGEADAGLVYVTDAKSAGNKVSTVDDPAFAKVVNKYPIATVKGTKHAEQAAQFKDMVTGQTGQEILAAAGFKPASS